MTTETKISPQGTKRLYALDCISQMCYFAKINIEYCSIALKGLENGGLKDTVILYREQQQNWLNKILRSLKQYKFAGVDLYTEMVNDLEDMPMIAMFDIIGNLKMAKDMEGISDVVNELKDLEDIEPIKTNLIALIRNEKNKNL